MNARLLLFIAISLCLACGKDKLNGEFQAVEGRYRWDSTAVQRDAWTHSTLYAAKINISYEVEFNGEGEMLFYKNGTLIAQEKYKFLDKENSNGTITLEIKLKGKTSETWDIDQRIKVTSSENKFTLTRFPFPAVENANTYLKEYKSSSNYFTKIK